MADETTPLLDDEAARSPPKDEVEDRLPKLQLFLLSCSRTMEPITFFSIFPYVNQMIWRTGDAPKSASGFYSGLIESLFALSQIVFMPIAARAAGRFGKRTVVVVSMFGMSIPTFLFGFSTAIWQMAACRVVAGICASYVVPLRLMFYQVSTPKTRPRVFSFWAVCNNMGMVLGPFFGGMLANPAEQYPSVFGSVALLKQYPYSLPSMFGGLLIAATALNSFFLLEETSSGPAAAVERSMTTWELLKSPGVKPAMFLFTHTMIMALAYTAVSPVFYFVDVEQGGYGFTPILISTFLAIAGSSQAVWTLFAYPPLERRLGRLGLLKMSYSLWPLFFLLHPVCNALLRLDAIAAFWAAAPTVSFLGNGIASLSFPTVQLVLNDVAPTAQTLDTINTLTMVMLSAVRMMAPGIAASVYALTLQTRILKGQLFWVGMAALPVGARVATRWLEGVYKRD